MRGLMVLWELILLLCEISRSFMLCWIVLSKKCSKSPWGVGKTHAPAQTCDFILWAFNRSSKVRSTRLKSHCSAWKMRKVSSLFLPPAVTKSSCLGDVYRKLGLYFEIFLLTWCLHSANNVRATFIFLLHYVYNLSALSAEIQQHHGYLQYYGRLQQWIITILA